MRLLRIQHNETIQHWRERGYIKTLPNTPGQALHYSVQHIDKVLAAHSRNFKTPPTVNALLRREIVLLTPDEVRTKLGVKKGVYQRLVKGRCLEVVRIGHQTRVTRASVAAYKEQQEQQIEQEMERKDVCHVLGLGSVNVAKLVKAGRLAAGKSQGTRDPILKTSVATLLRELLPEGIDPYGWIEDRLGSTLPLCSLHDVEQLQLDRPTYQFVRLITDRHVIGIRHPMSGRLRLAPETWLAYLEATEDPITDTQLTCVFGAKSVNRHAWEQNHPEWRSCHLHQHSDAALYSVCVLGLLQRHLSKGGSPAKWFKGRLEKGISTIGLPTAARILGVSTQEVLALMQQGKLTGLRRPDGMWRYSRTAVEVLSRRRAKAARSD